MTASPNCTSCVLLPVNLHDKLQFEELRRQRVLCGWNFQDEVLEQWRSNMDAKLKSLFWITFSFDAVAQAQAPDTKPVAPFHDQDGSPIFPIGHISLDSTLSPPDETQAKADRSVLLICDFFVKKEFRSSGVGRAAMDMIESYASQEPYGSPNCQAVAVNTFTRKYSEYDTPEWGGIVKFLAPDEHFVIPPLERCNEVWYTKRGFVKYKEEPRWPLKLKDGGTHYIVASFFRKNLQ